MLLLALLVMAVTSLQFLVKSVPSTQEVIPCTTDVLQAQQAIGSRLL